MTSSASSFDTRHYAIVGGAIDAATSDFYYQYAMSRAASGNIDLSDPQAPGTPSAYGDPIMEMLLETLRPLVERETAKSLFPTYSYFRVYRTGDRLERHRDRPACEISVTLNLGPADRAPWPIWIAGPLAATPVSLSQGDGVIYRGCDCEHWRDTFTGNHAAQVFLHYVDKSGPNAEWKFDKRTSLGSLRSAVKAVS